ncbi:MmcQ-like protein [Arachidicoccus ginsenosidimutans]|uniref:MmcQ/YjbR family DNA-binding protein n=1 Tax=Arachidicoccus sp. BS20 TaxID=1850526 RepID=UPI0007F12179|nr:MmcQ/YjbR family DNA-binding protein [Arachidicoccus sp. BS20]ANI89855.1 MmcQ-like protein [Arachidicoccus sp. BS20]
MFLDEIRDYALSLPDVEEYFPFGEETFVYKTSGKIFLLIASDETPLRINVKCDPDEAIELREGYSSIIPGYHMNKKHWNTIILDGNVERNVVLDCIKKSRELVGKRSK